MLNFLGFASAALVGVALDQCLKRLIGYANLHIATLWGVLMQGQSEYGNLTALFSTTGFGALRNPALTSRQIVRQGL